MIVYEWKNRNLNKPKVQLVKDWVAYFFAFTIIINGLSEIGQIGIKYIRYNESVLPPLDRESPVSIINLVNKSNDYYWSTPSDFSSQILMQSKSASKYHFYPPWVAACSKCNAEIIDSLANYKPRVVDMPLEYTIWGNKIQNYGKEIKNYLDAHYYHVPDFRLARYYFLKEQSAKINNILSKEGYIVQK